MKKIQKRGPEGFGLPRKISLQEILLYWWYPSLCFLFVPRLSKEIDLFSEQELNLLPIGNLIGKARQKLKLKKVDYRQFLGLHSFELYFSEKNIFDSNRILVKIKKTLMCIALLYEIKAIKRKAFFSKELARRKRLRLL